jgi:hypothetical protein
MNMCQKAKIGEGEWHNLISLFFLSFTSKELLKTPCSCPHVVDIAMGDPKVGADSLRPRRRAPKLWYKYITCRLNMVKANIYIL